MSCLGQEDDKHVLLSCPQARTFIREMAEHERGYSLQEKIKLYKKSNHPRLELRLRLGGAPVSSWRVIRWSLFALPSLTNILYRSRKTFSEVKHKVQNNLNNRCILCRGV
jgi:hypothetical protein